MGLGARLVLEGPVIPNLTNYDWNPRPGFVAPQTLCSQPEPPDPEPVQNGMELETPKNPPPNPGPIPLLVAFAGAAVTVCPSLRCLCDDSGFCVCDWETQEILKKLLKQSSSVIS